MLFRKYCLSLYIFLSCFLSVSLASSSKRRRVSDFELNVCDYVVSDRMLKAIRADDVSLYLSHKNALLDAYLCQAAYDGSFAIVASIYAKMDKKTFFLCTNHDGIGLIHLACQGSSSRPDSDERALERLKLVKFLVKAYCAACCGYNYARLSLFFDSRGYTVLHSAAHGGNLAIVDYLLSLGVNGLGIFCRGGSTTPSQILRKQHNFSGDDIFGLNDKWEAARKRCYCVIL